MLAILQKAKIGLLFFCLLFSVAFFFPMVNQPLRAHSGEDHDLLLPQGQTANDQAKKLEEIRQQIADTQTKIDEAQKKQITLSNEIIYQDNKIKLTELKIQETESEISALTGQINRLEGELTTLSEVFAERAVETYKLKRYGDSLVVLLTSANVSEFISRFNSLQRIQQNDRELLLEMQTAQTDYVDQRSQVEELHDRLEGQKNTLANQKLQKQNLLKVTQSDEKKYQALLASLKADASSIERALANLGAKIGPVNKGDVIGVAGNTGCSTGSHLHFEVMTPAKVENGVLIGRGNKKNGEDYINNGQLQHPLPGSIVTWPFGKVYYILNSGGSAHTGVDFAYNHSDRVTAGQPIFATDKGIAYYAEDSQSCAITGTKGKGIIIDHQNDIVTLYWHMP